MPVSARDSIVPAELALNIPTSSTVADPDSVKTWLYDVVSLVTVVVVLVVVAEARAKPEVVISVTRAV